MTSFLYLDGPYVSEREGYGTYAVETKDDLKVQLKSHRSVVKSQLMSSKIVRFLWASTLYILSSFTYVDLLHPTV